MAPGSYKWKSSVKEVNEGVDKVRNQLDSLIKMDNLKKQIYANPNTKVEVLVKTKRPQEDWSSILSEASETKPNLHRTKKPNAVRKKKKMTPPKAKKNLDEVDHKNSVKSGGGAGHKFSKRTLQIFLKEMRLALKHEDSSQLNKILEDLEYVAANLNQVEAAPEALEALDVALYKTEAKKAASDCEVLRRNVVKLEAKVAILNSESEAKELKIKELKAIIGRLTSNSNEMLGVLTSKADLEDKLRLVEIASNKKSQEISAEKFKNGQLELKLKASEIEIEKLRKIIQDFKMTGMQNFQDFDQILESKKSRHLSQNEDEETTIDLALSTDVEKSVEEDPDSALGPSQKTEPVIPEPGILEPLHHSTGQSSEEMSFRPLELSETKSSVNWTKSSSLANWSNVLTADKTPKAPPGVEVATSKAGQASQDQVMKNVDAKVAAYLNKLRNDERFQISLSSELDNKKSATGANGRKSFDQNETKMSFTSTDFADISTLTELKFRQGLEASLDFSEDNSDK